MNITEITDNTIFDYIPSEINYDNPTNFLYNPNTSNLHKRSQQIIYGSGVDDYVYNEIKKAKYQGCYDPGSLGNKNIFNGAKNAVIFSESNLNQNRTKKILKKCAKL